MTTTPAWPIWQRILFRYAFVFFGLILFSILTSALSLDKYLWEPLVKFVAAKIFGVGSVANINNGSGDKLYDWVWYGCLLLLSGLLGTLFNLIDFKRKEYNRVQAWLHYLLSVYLAFMLLTYGVIKLYGSQFPPPNLLRLHETYGHSSPMRLLWTFMGASKAYVIFAGACETIPGVLLCFRRTRMLGALIAFGVMTNVFALNIFYDVPVKLFSFQLVLISLFLLLPELSRLLRFFFFNKPVPAAKHTPITKNKYWYWGITGVQFLLVGAFVLAMANSARQGMQLYGNDREKPALYGIYDVNEFILNGSTITKGQLNNSRWDKVIFDYLDYSNIIYASGKRETLASAIDTSKQLFTLEEQDFSYHLQGDTLLTLNGRYGTDTLQVTLQRYDLKRFGLLNRGFNWVNESPHNRYDQ